ncbi:CPBP family intramembrane glutamic endopeptidase [Clostridioides difficile]|uniref:CAAX amino terminal protease family protein n=2 Tax=Clostridioides difficile TaxID=1496 RepID=D5Q170_CLODI|nr:CPBP family intramembrane glutamic endopeptidase [Clostridioides difficile]AVD35904.1 CPBP family intramembrane metalloprotease [Clostridioides difficile]AVD40648.1 CPBP family intramembrane metalloprotease [Clostridioides difficile]AVD44159.1 CPBP family intramembrane metalloprotease [Clostridioides difficile]EFH08350.1 CAAX amino terminal protease family protein [Clostridioides difficile NAP08]EFH16779.1 CAAX amino terminal protease family protein [Clostridioides difficile NAP07]
MKYSYKKCIIDSILLMLIVQLLRMILNYVLLSQFEFTLENFNIINLISFTLVGLSLILFLKDNSLYNKVRNRKITEAFEENKNSILIEKCKLILFVVVLSLAIISTYCTKGYVFFNVTMMTLSVFIVPIFEELFFREYIWNYLSNFIKSKIKIICITSILSGIYNIGYIDIIRNYIALYNNSSYTFEVIISKIIIGTVFGIVLGLVRYRFRDVRLCILLRSLFAIFIR